MKASRMSPLALSGLALAQSNMTLTEVLGSKNDTLSLLTGVLASVPDLASSLANATNITILAPSNEALLSFANSSNIKNISSVDPGMVTALLSYHVLNGTYYASNFTDMMPMFIKTLLDNTTYENVTGGQVVEGMKMGDGVSFYSALRMESNVTEADLNFTGGVVHVINKVLTIPMNLTASAVEANLTSAAGAITSAKLGSMLDGMENITVFAPSNEAFSSIGSILGNLSESDIKDILSYHVVPATLGYSSDLKNGTVKAADGKDLNIRISNGTVYVNSAKVIVPNVLIENGVVHVIDNVLNPNGTDNSNTAIPTATTPAFSGASSATSGGVPFTSGVGTPTGTAAQGVTPTGNAQSTSTSKQAAPHATAAVALGALFGGAVVAFNGL